MFCVRRTAPPRPIEPDLLPCLCIQNKRPQSWFVPQTGKPNYVSILIFHPELLDNDPLVEYVLVCAHPSPRVRVLDNG